MIVYSRDFGKITLLGKGIRKPTSRKRGSLEVFSYIKFAGARGKNLDLITEAEIIESFSPIRCDLRKTSLAYFFMEAIGRTTHEGEQNMEVYNLLIDYLGRLRKDKHLKKMRLNFILELLTLQGFWPKDKKMINPDSVLRDVVEREMNSFRVGKRLLS